MGLGFSAGEFLIGQGHPELRYPVLTEELAIQGHIDTPAFSMYLNDVHSHGSILFGGIDHAKYTGELKMLNMYRLDNEDESEVCAASILITLGIQTTLEKFWGFFAII
jgi:hypothetical protein